MKIVIGSDHAGFELKSTVIDYLQTKEYKVIDKGTDSELSTDYPTFGHAVANTIEDGEVELGILICGSGNGVAMTANKHIGVRCALCWTKEISALSRAHNDANILALPARFVSKVEALEIVDAFITTEFEGGRHERRVNLIGI